MGAAYKIEALEHRICFSAPPFTLAGPGVFSEDFRITRFAPAQSFPAGMKQLSDGSILVAETDPGNVSYFGNSTGQLVRLADSTGAGVANSAGQVVADHLPPALTDLAVQGPFAFVTSSGTGDIAPTITVLQFGATPSSPMTVRGTLTFTFAPNWMHKTYAIATRPTPGHPNSIDLFFNIGSNTDSQTTDPSLLTTISSNDGGFSGTAHPDSIYKLTMSPTKHGLKYSNLTEIAFGLRNAAGIAIQSGTGDLYFEDNGINGGLSGNDNPQLSADELNKIPAAQIGVGPVPDFGFAHDYIVQATGERVGSGAVQPLTAFLPINGSISEGPQHIGFSPASFPSGLNNGVWVGNFGISNYFGDGTLNPQNPVDYYNANNGSYFQIIGNDEPAVGHFVGFLGTSDSMFIADLAPINDFNTAHNGVIYQIKANPSIGTISGTTFADKNRDGIFSTTRESIVPHQTVYLDENDNGVLDAGDRVTTSDRHGRYVFSVPAGRYVLRSVLTNHILVNTTGASHIVRIGPGQTLHATINLGEYTAPILVP